MDKEFINFRNVDLLDICDVLTKIEKSFNIKLDNEGLENANTFKSLCDLVISKIDLEHEENCTTQHAFYMLRNAIASVNGINKCDVSTHTKLCKLFPKEERLISIAKIEDELGFRINLLKPKQWIVSMFAFTLIASGIFCFYNLFAGMAGLLISAAALKLAGKFGKEMHLKTVGDLACKISRESYSKVRRNNTINKNEVEQKLRELFVSDLDLEPAMLTRRTTF
jgi:acyl carrier protein